MTASRIIPTSDLLGRAAIVVVLPDRTIRSRVRMVQARHGVVAVAFASGDVITLMARAVIGCIDPQLHIADAPHEADYVH